MLLRQPRSSVYQREKKSTNPNEWIELRVFTGKLVKSIKLAARMQIVCVVRVAITISFFEYLNDFSTQNHQFLTIF